MCEPLSVGVHACRRANINPETTALVMGAGPIGLVTMMAARAFGAPRIVVVDVDDYRLSVAKKLGADDTVKVSTNMQVCIFLIRCSLRDIFNFLPSLFLVNLASRLPIWVRASLILALKFFMSTLMKFGWKEGWVKIRLFHSRS